MPCIAHRPAAGLIALLSILGCELPIPSEPSRGILGVWILAAQISGPSGSAWATTSCHQVGPLAITEQRANGALSWTLERTTTCHPTFRELEGQVFYQDTWERTPWARTRSDSIWITTPYAGLLPDDYVCTYSGSIRGERPPRMFGVVACDPPVNIFAGPPELPTLRGTWSAILP